MAQGMELVITRDGDEGEKRFSLRPGVEVRIGRNSDSQLVVDYDGVSGKHAELFLGPSSQGVMPPLLVRDVSKNGTGIRAGPEADAEAWVDPKTPPAWQRLENGMPRPVEVGWQLIVPARSRKESTSTNKPQQLTQLQRTLTIARMTPFTIEEPKPPPVRHLPKAAASMLEDSEEAEREALARLLGDVPPAPEALAGGQLVAEDVSKRKKRKEGKKEKGKEGDDPKKPGKKDKERKKHKDKAPLPAGVADVMDEIDQELAFTVNKPKAAAAPVGLGYGEDPPRSARPKRRARADAEGAGVDTPEGATEHMMRVVQKAAGAKTRGGEAPDSAVPGPGQRELHSPRPARRAAAAPAGLRLTEGALAAAGVGLPSAGAIESELRSVSPISTPGVFPFQQSEKPKKKRKADLSPGGVEKRRRRRQK